MKLSWRSILCGAVGLLVGLTAALAHHSFAAEFDNAKQATLKGTITKVEWTNPHTYFYLSMPRMKTARKVIGLSKAAPNVLYRQGWKPDTLKIGDQVTVIGSRAKNGTNLVSENPPLRLWCDPSKSKRLELT